jgi:hypothetical protein
MSPKSVPRFWDKDMRKLKSDCVERDSRSTLLRAAYAAIHATEV